MTHEELFGEIADQLEDPINSPYICDQLSFARTAAKAADTDFIWRAQEKLFEMGMGSGFREFIEIDPHVLGSDHSPRRQSARILRLAMAATILDDPETTL